MPALKLFPLLSSLPSNSPETDFFIQGVKSHFETDRRFHQSDFFKKQSEFLKQQFIHRSVSSPGFRLFFVSHILSEMLLDRVLLLESREHGEAFYNTLAQVDMDNLHSCFQHIPSYQKKNMMEFLNRFTTSRYLFTYTEDEALLFALNRVCKSAGTGSLESKHLPDFRQIISIAEKEMQKEYIDFFNHFDPSLNTNTLL